LAHLEKNASKRAAMPAKSAVKSSNWSEKIEKMRETYPNAYRPWTTAQDSELKQYFENGAALAEISKKLGRHKGSIEMRLKKHYGEDISL